MKKIITYLILVLSLVVFIYLGKSKLGAFFCNQGNYYYEQKLYKKAEIYYKNSIKVDSKAWMAHLGLAQVYLDSKDYLAAISEYKIVLNMNPSCVRAYESLSYIYELRGNYVEALQVLARGQKENTNEEGIKEALKNCCHAYLIKSLNKSLELFLAQKTTEAIFMLDNVLMQCPGNALAYYTLGCYYFSSEDYVNAKINLNKSVDIDPRFQLAHKLLADLYLEIGYSEKAIFHAQKVVAIDNQDASGYHELGLLFMLSERYAEALPYLKKAVSLAPHNVEFAYSLASVYRDNKMLSQAIVEYTKVAALKDNYPNLHNDLADIYLILNKPDQALVEYRKEVRYCQDRIKYTPFDPVVLNSYAYALNGAGESILAQEVAENLVFKYPGYRNAHLTMSKIYEKNKKHDLALASLEKARRLSPGEKFINEEIFKLKQAALIRKNISQRK